MVLIALCPGWVGDTEASSAQRRPPPARERALRGWHHELISSHRKLLWPNTMAASLFSNFLKRSIAPFFCSRCFGRVPMWEKPSAQRLRNGVLAHRNPKLALHHANQIAATPAHYAIPRQIGPRLNERF